MANGGEEWRIILQTEEAGAAGGRGAAGGIAPASPESAESKQARAEDQAFKKSVEPVAFNVGKFFGQLVGVASVLAFVIQMIRRSKIFSTFMDTFLTIIATFIDIMLIPLIPLFTAMLKGMVNLIPIAMVLSQKVSEFLKDPTSGIKKTFEWIGDTIQKIFKFISNFFSSLGFGGLGTMFAGIGKTLGDFWSKVAQHFGVLAEHLKKIWGDPALSTWEKVKQSALAFWNDFIKPVAKDAWVAIVTIFKDYVWPEIVSIWNTQVMTRVKSAVEGLLVKIGEFAGIEVKPTGNVWNTFTQLAAGAFEKMKDTFHLIVLLPIQSWFEWFKGLVETSWVAFTGWLTREWRWFVHDYLQMEWHVLVNSVLTGFIRMIVAIIEMTKSIGTSIVKLGIQTALGPLGFLPDVSNALTKFVNSMTNFDVAESIGSGLTSLFEKLGLLTPPDELTRQQEAVMERQPDFGKEVGKPIRDYLAQFPLSSVLDPVKNAITQQGGLIPALKDVSETLIIAQDNISTYTSQVGSYTDGVREFEEKLNSAFPPSVSRVLTTATAPNDFIGPVLPAIQENAVSSGVQSGIINSLSRVGSIIYDNMMAPINALKSILGIGGNKSEREQRTTGYQVSEPIKQLGDFSAGLVKATEATDTFTKTTKGIVGSGDSAKIFEDIKSLLLKFFDIIKDMKEKMMPEFFTSVERSLSSATKLLESVVTGLTSVVSAIALLSGSLLLFSMSILSTFYSSSSNMNTLIGIANEAVEILRQISSKLPTGSKQSGDPFIEQTGLYTLHRGERVISARENQNITNNYSKPINIQNVFNMGGQIGNAIAVKRMSTGVEEAVKVGAMRIR